MSPIVNKEPLSLFSFHIFPSMLCQQDQIMVLYGLSQGFNHAIFKPVPYMDINDKNRGKYSQYIIPTNLTFYNM